MRYSIGIETTCDETSLALLKNKEIIKCLVWSQIEDFKKFGGVVPSLASELHMQRLPILLKKIIDEYPEIWKKIEWVSYAQNPGLIGCLHVGKIFAETIAWIKKIPTIGVDHVQAHLAINKDIKKKDFPALGLVVSGGHTSMFLLTKKEGVMQFQLLGRTLDDAAGEAFDKIGRAFGLSYPAGPEIERLAEKGKNSYVLNVYSSKKDLNFSFSGLKTHAITTIKKEGKKLKKTDFAASLQETIFNVIIKKIRLSQKRYGFNSVLFGGGVAANLVLRKKAQQALQIPVFFPPKMYCTDNAAMIGILGSDCFKINKCKD